MGVTKQFAKYLDAVTTPGIKMLEVAGDSFKRFNDIRLKKGSFANMSGAERIGGMVGAGAAGLTSGALGLGGTFIGGVGGTLVGVPFFAGKWGLGKAGNFLKGAARGSGLDVAASKAGRGIKEVGGKAKTSLGNLKRKKVGEEATEATLKGTASSKTKSAPTQKVTVGDDGTVSFTHDGVVYKKYKNPNWKEGDWRKSKDNPSGRNQFLYTADEQFINGKVFGEAKKSFEYEDISKIADDISTTETGERAGFNLGEFIDNHPLAGPGLLVGGGFLLSELLDDD